MSKARIIHELHDDLGVTISEAEKAYDIALEYIRLRSTIGDHPENYEPSEYVLVKASAQPEAKEIGYAECASAMLKMWIDNVLTDGEYNRIMDKLNANYNEERRQDD